MSSMVKCLVCQSEQTGEVYQPLGSKRGAVVYLCYTCRLFFSRHKQKPPYNHIPSISHTACYGGLRIGKGQRAKASLEFINQSLNVQTLKRVLDVGSNRGRFTQELLTIAPNSLIVAVEPDTTVIPEWMYFDRRIVVREGPIEQIELTGQFDLIYCSHTLEHLDNPVQVLCQLREVLAPDGWLFLEVPDIGALMMRDDLCEELFLDKHVSHFTLPALRYLLVITGLNPVFVSRDGENISIMAQKSKDTISYEMPTFDPQLALELYRETLLKNLAQLPILTRYWNDRAKRQRVTAWGIGRIFSALVSAGLDVMKLYGLVDSYLPLDCVFERRVFRPPEVLQGSQPELLPEVIMICSRSSQSEIKQAAGQIVPTAEAIGWDEV